MFNLFWKLEVEYILILRKAFNQCGFKTKKNSIPQMFDVDDTFELQHKACLKIKKISN